MKMFIETSHSGSDLASGSEAVQKKQNPNEIAESSRASERLFLDLVDQKKFNDHSLFIAEILSDQSMVNVFVYPAKFGKSTSLSMLYTFLSKQVDLKTQEVFSELEIRKSVNSMQHLGKYTVIHLNFTNMKSNNYDEFFILLSREMSTIFRQHSYVIEDQDCAIDIDKFKLIANADQDVISLIDLTGSLKFLTESITRFNQTKKCQKTYECPVVLVDGYDVPLSYSGKEQKKYEELLQIFFSKALKDNRYLSHAYIMGSSKEKVLPNNCRFHSTDDESYSKYFSLNGQEVKYYQGYVS